MSNRQNITDEGKPIMRKAISLVVVFIISLVVFSTKSLAHTSLQTSSPKDGETITTSLQQIQVVFGTKIEQSSTLTMTNEEGHSVPLEHSTIERNELVATSSQVLNNGRYVVKWTIIGADAHPREGTFSFLVDVPTESKQTQKIDLGEKQEEKKVEQPQQPVRQHNISPIVIPSIMGALLVIAAGSAIWLIRRGD